MTTSAKLFPRDSSDPLLIRSPDGGAQDGYEAVWEHVHGRPITYPPARFEEPILMWPAHAAWVPSAREPGVAEKLLGVFGERRLELGCLRLDAGAVHAMPSRPGARLIVVLAGAVRADGVELGLQGAAQLAAGECARIAAPAAAEVLVVGLPIFGA